jgi:flagellar L-ring protein precursor FlgH
LNRGLFLAAVASLLAGCSGELSEIGRPPYMSPVGTGIGPALVAGNEYASPPPKKFSLWSDRQSRLFTDPRALSVGDILTVSISINDKAQFKNQSDRKRDSSRSLGLGGSLSSGGASGSLDVSGEINSGTSTSGSGATVRSESIDLLVAAVVTDVLPNGNLVIAGSQEVRVNAELRILTIAGIVRPSDIGAENTISYDRIAEARISYGGRGRITEVQQPGYGQQVLDAVLPF